MLRHSKAHHGQGHVREEEENVSRDEINKAESQRNIQTHIKSEVDSAKYLCNKCDYHAKKKVQLQKHNESTRRCQVFL